MGGGGMLTKPPRLVPRHPLGEFSTGPRRHPNTSLSMGIDNLTEVFCTFSADLSALGFSQDCTLKVGVPIPAY